MFFWKASDGRPKIVVVIGIWLLCGLLELTVVAMIVMMLSSNAAISATGELFDYIFVFTCFGFLLFVAVWQFAEIYWITYCYLTVVDNGGDDVGDIEDISSAESDDWA